tara:strand:- start:3861 stop:4256 length:396 start_codon:yes stop_codon:yes gene_type:complete
MDYKISHTTIILWSDETYLTPKARHLYALKFKAHGELSRLGGIAALHEVIHDQYKGRVFRSDGSFWVIPYGLVDKVYNEGGGADGGWHQRQRKYADQMPTKGFPKRLLTRLQFWHIFFHAIGDPIEFEDHT